MTTYGLSLLLIEESEVNARLTRTFLGECQTLVVRQIEWVRSAVEALARLEVATYDVLLLDAQVGGDAGLALLREVRGRGIHTPAILLSALADESLAVEATQAGAFYFLLKAGLSPMLLAVAIRYVIELERRRIERERSDEALRRSEERFRALVENSSDVFVLLDRRLRLVYSSRSLVRTLGYTPDMAISKEFLDPVHPDDVEEVRATVLRSLASPGVPVATEFRYRHRNGAWVTMEAVFSNRLEDPAVRGVVGNLRDMGRRRRTEAALRQSEEKFRLFFERSPVANYVSSADGTLLACNVAFSRLFGFGSVAEALTVNLYNLYEDRTVRDQFLDELKKRRSVEHFEKDLRRRDGRIVETFESAIGTFDESGELVEIHGYITDDTVRRKAAESERHAQKMEAIGRLAGGMAHDFNNMLTSILGYSELALQRTPADDPRRPLIEEVRKAGDRARALTGQLLAFSRRQSITPAINDLNQLVSGLEKMLGRLIGEDVDLLTALHPEAGSVLAGQGQIEQVIMNLALNARDAMPGGGRLAIETNPLTERERLELDLPIGSYSVLAVTDSGIGMTAEVKAHLFEPFFTTKEQGKGTGLGLSTVYAIVRQLGGQIRVASRQAEGARFEVILPRSPAARPAEMARPEPTTRHGSETILLVEDDETVRRLSKAVLSSHGYRIIDAADGREALEVLAHHGGAIHLLLSDVVMPEMGGPELADHFRVLYPLAKVLFVSGYPDRILEKEGRVVSGVEFLPKPFLPDALLRRVRSVLDGDGAVTAAPSVAGAPAVVVPPPID